MTETAPEQGGFYRHSWGGRIRARAQRRAGELLKQMEPVSGARNDLRTAPSLGRTAAAREAGMSERQAKTAQRLAEIPEDEFEQAIEAGGTITEMTEKPKDREGDPAPKTWTGSGRHTFHIGR